MQQLHLVGFTADFNSLIFSSRKGAKSGGFTLPLNEDLVALVAEALRRRQETGAGVEVPPEVASAVPGLRRQSLLSPREIQARLRAGRSTGQVAAEAGVDEEWVARFAAPVAAERSQVVNQARQLRYAKPRRGPSAETLGTSVRWNLAERGVRLTNDEFDAGWSGYQVANHTWMVTFSFVSRKRAQLAQWEVELGEAEIYARNRLASDLGYVEPGRRRRSLESLLPEQPKAAPKLAERAATAALARPRLSDLRPAGGPADEAGPATAEPPTPSPNGAAEAAAPAPEPAGAKKAARGSSTKKTASRPTSSKAAAAKTARAAKATKAATKVTKASKPVKATKASKALKADKATGAIKADRATRATRATKATKASKASKASGANRPGRAVVAVKAARAGGPGAKRAAAGHTLKRGPAKSTSLPTAKAQPTGRARAASVPVRPSARTGGRAPARGTTTPAAKSAGRSTAGRGRTAPADEPPAAPAPSPRTELEKRKLEILRGEPSRARTRLGSGRPQQMSRPGGAGAPQVPTAAREAGGARPTAPQPEAERGPVQGATVPGATGQADGEAAAPAPDNTAQPTGAATASPEGEAPRRPRAEEPAQVWAMPSSSPPPEPEPREAFAPARGGSPDDEADDSRLDVGGPVSGSPATAGPAREAGDGADQPGRGEEPTDRVLTIRAKRATPPTGEGEPEAELVLPANRPPLRPAQPAAQPRRRRFGRASR